MATNASKTHQGLLKNFKKCHTKVMSSMSDNIDESSLGGVQITRVCEGNNTWVSVRGFWSHLAVMASSRYHNSQFRIRYVPNVSTSGHSPAEKHTPALIGDRTF